ncbi:hypothetical protein BC828DRAFT_372931 [Blastocladiella britannica]|nr:hypothetical protein BC828DRAFT_372931 [Blastocladiella britannica]
MILNDQVLEHILYCAAPAQRTLPALRNVLAAVPRAVAPNMLALALGAGNMEALGPVQLVRYGQGADLLQQLPRLLVADHLKPLLLAAAECNNLDALRWCARELGPDSICRHTWTGADNIMTVAAKNGHVPVLAWLVEHRRQARIPNNRQGEAQEAAAAAGHIQILDWFRTTPGRKANQEAILRGAARGRLQVLEWWWTHLQHSAKGREFKNLWVDAMQLASKAGNVAAMAWIWERAGMHRCLPDRNTYTKLVRAGLNSDKLPAIQWWWDTYRACVNVDHGFAVHVSIRKAISKGNLELVQWFWEKTMVTNELIGYTASGEPHKVDWKLIDPWVKEQSFSVELLEWWLTMAQKHGWPIDWTFQMVSMTTIINRADGLEWAWFNRPLGDSGASLLKHTLLSALYYGSLSCMEWAWDNRRLCSFRTRVPMFYWEHLAKQNRMGLLEWWERNVGFDGETLVELFQALTVTDRLETLTWAYGLSLKPDASGTKLQTPGNERIAEIFWPRSPSPRIAAFWQDFASHHTLAHAPNMATLWQAVSQLDRPSMLQWWLKYHSDAIETILTLYSPIGLDSALGKRSYRAFEWWVALLLQHRRPLVFPHGTFYHGKPYQILRELRSHRGVAVYRLTQDGSGRDLWE